MHGFGATLWRVDRTHGVGGSAAANNEIQIETGWLTALGTLGTREEGQIVLGATKDTEIMCLVAQKVCV